MTFFSQVEGAIREKITGETIQFRLNKRIPNNWNPNYI
jgi:hypothetical protein